MIMAAPCAAELWLRIEPLLLVAGRDELVRVARRCGIARFVRIEIFAFVPSCSRVVTAHVSVHLRRCLGLAPDCLLVRRLHFESWDDCGVLRGVEVWVRDVFGVVYCDVDWLGLGVYCFIFNKIIEYKWFLSLCFCSCCGLVLIKIGRILWIGKEIGLLCGMIFRFLVFWTWWPLCWRASLLTGIIRKSILRCRCPCLLVRWWMCRSVLIMRWWTPSDSCHRRRSRHLMMFQTCLWSRSLVWGQFLLESAFSALMVPILLSCCCGWIWPFRVSCILVGRRSASSRVTMLIWASNAWIKLSAIWWCCNIILILWEIPLQGVGNARWRMSFSGIWWCSNYVLGLFLRFPWLSVASIILQISVSILIHRNFVLFVAMPVRFRPFVVRS